MRRVAGHVLICLITALVLTAAAAPVLRTESSVVWAASAKKTKKKSSKKTTSKKKKKTTTTKRDGFIKKNGNYYYLKDGKKQTGWITVGNRKYYGIRNGSPKGRLARGWHKVGKKTYFFRQDTKLGLACSLAIDGVAKVNGITCIFNEDGELEECKYAGNTNGFVNKVGEMARMNQAKNNILASLVVAQACVETGYGSNIYHNNLFGIRAGSGYRKYDSWQDSIDDYVNFMHTYIPSIFGVRDSSSACWIIGRSGYAEAGGYGSALLSVVYQQNLTRFNK